MLKFVVAFSTLLCLAAAAAVVLASGTDANNIPNDDEDTDDDDDDAPIREFGPRNEFGPSTDSVRVIINNINPHVGYLITMCSIPDSVLQRLPEAVNYLHRTFSTHHLTNESFSSMEEFEAVKAVYDGLFKHKPSGNYTETMWTAVDYLFVAYLISKEAAPRQREFEETLARMPNVDFADPEMVLRFYHHHHEFYALSAEAWKRVDRMVTESVLLPKIEKHGFDCLAFFNGIKKHELRKIWHFTKKPAIRRQLKLNDERFDYDSIHRHFHVLCEWIDTIKDNMKKLKALRSIKSLKYECLNIELGGVCDGVMPIGLYTDWFVIDLGCCGATEYNLTELAPSIRRSVKPTRAIEDVRQQQH